MLQVPTLQKLLFLQEFLAPPQVPVASVPFCTIGANLCSLAFGQLRRWSCAPFCPHSQYVSVSSCPNLSWYALEYPWPDLAAMSHPWASLFNLNLEKAFFAREVGFKPNSTYVCAALENVSFCHSNCQSMSFIILIFRLALLRDWSRLDSSAGAMMMMMI